MTKKYRLAVSDIVQVHIEGVTQDEQGGEKSFQMKLQCKRLPMAEVAPSEPTAIEDILRKVAVGWADQNLVVGEDGLPADFDAEAFEAALLLPQLPAIAYGKYVVAVGAKVKN
jgi:hypothetical protein